MITITEVAKRPNGTGSIFRRGRFWWVKYYRHGVPYSESTKSEFEQDAKNLLARRLGDIVTGRFHGLAPERVTISELCNLVEQDYEHARKRDLATLRWRIAKHLEPRLGPTRAVQFGQQQAKKYVADRRRQGAADATINRELAIVRRGFTLALQNDPPLVMRAPHIPKLDEDNVREGFLEHDQYLKLREELPRHLKPLLVVAYYVGSRIGELRQVLWDQVDLMTGEIRLAKRQTKGKAARTLPIYGEMKHWLAIQKQERDQKWPDCPRVFHYLGRPIGSHIKGWKEACGRAGVPGLLFHDLRRCAVRNMERAGFPRKLAMSISGHKTEAVYRRYDIVSPEDLKIARAKMETYLDQRQSEVAGGNNPVATQSLTKPGHLN